MLNPLYFQDVTKFPEDKFECKVNCIEYKQIVQKGYEVMRSKKIVLSGLCINIEDKLPILRKRLEHLGGYFTEYKIVIFENDSSDNTRSMLLQWQSENPNVYIIPCIEDVNCKLKFKQAVKYGQNSFKRMQRMVDYRNRVINFVKSKYANYNIFCMIDLDLSGPISMDGIAHSFGLYDTWDSISAFGLNGVTGSFGRPIYYDPLAYNDGSLSGEYIFNVPSILIKTLTKKRGHNPYLVQSGFAGLSLYKMYILRSGIDYIPKDGKYVCEHLIFHNNMIEKGFNRIYINPNMLVLVGPQGDVSKYPYY